jgi:hypothetical protein
VTKQDSVLKKIAYFQGRRDEVPNRRLAEELCKYKNRAGIKEIAENLSNGNPRIQADCLKVLYEIGYREPKLIADYVDDFLGVLQSRNNRLVWGAMIGLSTIASLKPESLGRHVDQIVETMKKGSVITIDSGISILASVASKEPALRKRIVSFLFNHLKTCRPKDVPQHSERVIVAINGENKAELGRILNSRLKELSPSQLKRVQKVLRVAEGK